MNLPYTNNHLHPPLKEHKKGGCDIMFQTIVENCSDAIIMVSAMGEIIYQSPSLQKLTGFSPDEINGKKIDALVFPEDSSIASEFFREILAEGGISKTTAYRLRHKDGHTILIEAIATNLLDNETVKALMFSFHCMTVKGSAEIETSEIKCDNNDIKINKCSEELQSLNKELDNIMHSVSHDLRAPLRAVKGYSQILEEDHGAMFNEEGKRLLDIIKYNTCKMEVLIDSLLLFSRLNRKQVQKTNVDMNELVEGSLFELNKTLKHNAKIKIGKLHSTSADYGLLHQVMVNLLSNAIIYSGQRKAPVVEVKSEKFFSEIIYSVKDNGAGFNMSYSHKLFGLFQRLHSIDEFEGTGIGLAIVQRILSKHGGKVWAEGKINKGATFYFSLPI